MIFPSLLKKWDTIWVFSPSSWLEEWSLKLLNQGIERLKSYWYNILFGKHYDKINFGSAWTAEERAQDFEFLLRDNSVKAIISTQWWDTTNSILPHINFDLVKENPKIIMWFSDMSVLLNSISFKTWLVTFLWPDVVWKFGNNFSAYDKEEFHNNLILWKWTIKPSDQSRKHINTSKSKPFFGTLRWGNIRCFLKLLWTEYRPNMQWSVLIMESVNKSALWFDSILEQLKQVGIFDEINGIIIWYNHNYQDSWQTIQDLVKQKTKWYDLNILQINDFWHNSNHSIFPIWMKVTVGNNEIKYDC